MPYLLGIDIGESTVTAAVCQRTDRTPYGRTAGPAAEAAWGPAQPVVLGASGPVIASALLLSPGGGLVAADGSAGHAAAQASGFVHRVGDDVPVRLGAHAFPAQALMAGMVGWVVGRLWQQEGQAPEWTAVAHPTGWGPYRLDLLRAAFGEAGLSEPALVPRAGAVVTSFQAVGRLPVSGTVLVVFRLGRTGLEVSLVNLYASGVYELIASLECADISGSDVDAAGAAAQRSILQAGVDVAVRTVAACGISAADLAGVLLAGAAAGHAVLADLLAAAFAVPVLQHGDPRVTVACGAALSGRPRTRRAPAAPVRVVPVRVVPQSPAGEAPVLAVAEAVSPGPQAALPPPRPPVQVTAAPVGRR